MTKDSQHQAVPKRAEQQKIVETGVICSDPMISLVWVYAPMLLNKINKILQGLNIQPLQRSSHIPKTSRNCTSNFSSKQIPTYCRAKQPVNGPPAFSGPCVGSYAAATATAAAGAASPVLSNPASADAADAGATAHAAGLI